MDIAFVSKLEFRKLTMINVCNSGLAHLSVHVEKEGGQLCGPEGKGDIRQQLTSHCRGTEGRHSFSHESHSRCNLRMIEVKRQQSTQLLEFLLIILNENFF